MADGEGWMVGDITAKLAEDAGQYISPASVAQTVEAPAVKTANASAPRLVSLPARRSWYIFDPLGKATGSSNYLSTGAPIENRARAQQILDSYQSHVNQGTPFERDTPPGGHKEAAEPHLWLRNSSGRTNWVIQDGREKHFLPLREGERDLAEKALDAYNEGGYDAVRQALPQDRFNATALKPPRLYLKKVTQSDPGRWIILDRGKSISTGAGLDRAKAEEALKNYVPWQREE